MWNMYRGCTIVVFFTLYQAASAVLTGVEVIQEDCSKTSCLILYRAENSRGVTWSEARDHCLASGAALAGVPDPTKHSRVVAIVDKQQPVGTWLSGRRADSDIQWRDMEGNNVTTLVEITAKGGDCAVLSSSISAPQKFHTTRCDDVTSAHTPICQYEPDDKGSCTTCDQCSDAIEFGGRCYVNTTASQGNWFTTQNFCRFTFGGNLAYAPYPSQVLYNGSDTPNGSRWTGVHKRPWQWTSGTGTNTSAEPVSMNYFEWTTPFGDDGFSKNCVKLEKNLLWNVEDCSARLSQFLCFRDLLAPSITTEMTTTDREQTSTDINPETSDKNIPVIVASVVAAVVLVAVLIIIAVILRRKFKRKSKAVKSLPAVEFASSGHPSSPNDNGQPSTPISQHPDANVPVSPIYLNTSSLRPEMTQQTSLNYDYVTDADVGAPSGERRDMYLTTDGQSPSYDSTEPQEDYEYVSSAPHVTSAGRVSGGYLTPIGGDPEPDTYEIPTTYVNSDTSRMYERLTR